MTDKEFNLQKKRVSALIKKWVKQIGLGWWTIEYEFFRESIDPSEKTTYEPPVISGRFVCSMATQADYYYRIAKISFYLPECKEISDSRLESCFVHELMHIFLSPMRSKSKSGEEEQVATSLADAIIWAREEGLKDSKKINKK